MINYLYGILAILSVMLIVQEVRCYRKELRRKNRLKHGETIDLSGLKR